MKNMIKKMVDEINCLLRDGYPYSALGIALALPDICGNIAYPGTAVAVHYKKWYDEYVSPISAIRPNDGFMTVDGEVCYKLRCAYLHSGNFNLGNGEVVKHIEKFAIHYNQDPNLRFIQIAQSTGGKYLMDIDLGIFCWQLCTAATSFYENYQQECSNSTIEIKNTTPTEEEQNALRALIEEKSGYTLEEMKEIKRKDGTFEIDIDFLT